MNNGPMALMGAPRCKALIRLARCKRASSEPIFARGASHRRRRLALHILLVAMLPATLSISCLDQEAATSLDENAVNWKHEHSKPEPKDERPSSAEPYMMGPSPEANPSRVVTLSPAMTDIVAALEASELLVGVTRFCDHPSARSVPRIGGFLDPSLEAVLATRPNLVIAEPSPGNRESVKRLAELGIPVLVVPHGGVAGARTAISAVGSRIGRHDEARALVASFDAALETIKEAASDRDPPRAAIIYGRDPLVLAGPGSFGDELLSLAGGENIARSAGTPYPAYPLELLISQQPDVIIEAAMLADGKAEALPRMEGTRHTKIPGNALLRPGPAIPASALQVLTALHPEAREEILAATLAWDRGRAIKE